MRQALLYYHLQVAFSGRRLDNLVTLEYLVVTMLDRTSKPVKVWLTTVRKLQFLAAIDERGSLQQELDYVLNKELRSRGFDPDKLPSPKRVLPASAQEAHAR